MALLAAGCSTGKQAAYYATLQEAVKAGPGLIKQEQAQLEFLLEKLADQDAITIEHVGKDQRPRVHITGAMFAPFYFIMAKMRAETPGEYMTRILAAIPQPGPTSAEILAQGVANVLPLGVSVGGMYGLGVYGMRQLAETAQRVGGVTDNRHWENSDNTLQQQHSDGSTATLKIQADNPSTVTEFAPPPVEPAPVP